MRILLIAGFFPPYAPMSATRASKFAKFMLARGHDVRVLATRNPKFPPVLPLEIPPERVIYAPIVDLAALPGRLLELPKVRATQDAGRDGSDSTESAAGTGMRRKTAIGRLGRLYRLMVNIPDPHIGWYWQALRAGRALLKTWRADIIFVSAPPHTGLLVGDRLSRRFGIPWVPEFRDLWTMHPYYDPPPWRRLIERTMERRTLASAAAMVTVTRTWHDLLAANTGKPTMFARNGFDPDDYPDNADAQSEASSDLSLLYAGGLYAGKRDPSPLFEAMARLGADTARVRVDFYGSPPEVVHALAARANVAHSVHAHDAIARDAVLAHQRRTDVLLLLRWNDPREHGVIAGKLFEYIGSARPILSVGATAGEAADIIRENRLGIVSDDPDAIAAQLRRWLDEKARTGRIEGPRREDRAPFSRHEQYARLEDFLATLLERRAPNPTFAAPVLSARPG